MYSDLVTPALPRRSRKGSAAAGGARDDRSCPASSSSCTGRAQVVVLKVVRQQQLGLFLIHRFHVQVSDPRPR